MTTLRVSDEITHKLQSPYRGQKCHGQKSPCFVFFLDFWLSDLDLGKAKQNLQHRQMLIMPLEVPAKLQSYWTRNNPLRQTHFLHVTKMLQHTVLDINLLCIRYKNEPKAFLLFSDHSPSEQAPSSRNTSYYKTSISLVQGDSFRYFMKYHHLSKNYAQGLC